MDSQTKKQLDAALSLAYDLSDSAQVDRCKIETLIDILCTLTSEGQTEEERMKVEEIIINAVKELERNTDRVFPKNVAQRRVGYGLSTIRYIMAQMAAEGKLIRLGQRGGYMTPRQMYQ